MVSLLTVVGALAAAGGGISLFSYPAMLEFGLNNMINLKRNGMVYPIYMNPPFPSNSSFYLFEVKNPKDTLAGAKPQLNLKGPYTYQSWIKRSNISFSDDEEVVSYETRRVLDWDGGSSADMDEKFFVLNPIVPSTMKTVQDIVLDRVPFKRVAEPVVFRAVNAILDTYKERLFTYRSPRELLDGKKVELLEAVTGLADRFGLTRFVPEGPPENIFGLVHAQMAFVQPLEIWTGVGSTKTKFAEVRKWKGKSSVDKWKGRCRIINGTNGELYKPLLTKGKPLKIFLTDLCRSFYLDPIGEAVTDQGIATYEYEVSSRLFLGARNNPRNRCFCTNERTYDCQYDGLVSMGPCFFNAPLFFSKPNMRDVDRRIRSLVDEDSIEVNLPEKQSFYVEPTTGSVVKVNLTLMGSFKVVRQANVRDLAYVQNLTYFPFFAVTELYALQILQDHYGYIFAGVSLFGVVMIWMGRRRSKVNRRLAD